MNCRDVAPTVCWAAKSPNTHTHTQLHNVVTDTMIKWQQSADYKKWFTVNRCCVIINKRIFVRVMNQTVCPDAAARVTEPHQGAFIIPGKLLLQPRGENNWLKLKLRLSRAASLITSEGFKVSSTSKASVRYSSSSVLFLLQRLLPRYMWYCNDYEFYQ